MKTLIALMLAAAMAAAGAKSGDRPGWLGIAYTVHSSAPSGTRAGWLYVRGVMANSPAARAGLRAADLIVAVDGRPVTFRDDVDVLRYLATIRPGQHISLTVSREQRARVIEVVPAPMTDATFERWRLNFELAKKSRNEAGVARTP